MTRFAVRPQYFNIVGYSRSKMSDEEFRDLISENLTCRVSAGEDCGREMEEYLARCFYVAVSGLQISNFYTGERTGKCQNRDNCFHEPGQHTARLRAQ